MHAMHRGYKYAMKKDSSIVHTAHGPIGTQVNARSGSGGTILAKSPSCPRVETINMQQQQDLKFPPSELCISNY